MRTFIPLLSCLLITSNAIAQEERPAEHDLFPLNTGMRWTYKIQGQDDRLVVNVAGVDRIGEARCVRLEARLGNRVIATEHLSLTKDGAFRHRLDSADIEPPLTICKFPATQGLTWEAQYKINDKRATLSYEIEEEEITVPAGKYKAVAVRSEIPDRAGAFRNTIWYAPKVGMVKQEIADGDRTVTLLLEKFERPSEKDNGKSPAKKSKQ